MNAANKRRGNARGYISSIKLSALTAGLVLALGASAQETKSDSSEGQKLEVMLVTGSRAKGHTVEDSPAPVDVIDAREISTAGSLEIGKLLQALEPSANFSTTFVSDGTDLIRPVTLRGLGPDQVLVLINGKRRHQQALVNVQQTIGRGSAGTDINAIPVSSIERIEVLRDGAAAQYGSDAIAGVVNIILKKQVGVTETTFEVGQTYKGDGEVYHGGVNTGFQLGAEGYLNLTAEYRKRGETNRAGPDTLRVDPPRVTQRIGDSETEDRYLWLNGGLPVGSGTLYWFGGASRRTGDSSGFFRSAGDGRTVPAVYPNGFLPNILTEAQDRSLAVGFRAPMNDKWDWDVSVNHGSNEFDFSERNSINVSWWYEPQASGGIFAASPVSADTGKLKYDETSFNLDFHGQTNWNLGANPVFIGTGFEYRTENYRIDAGDPVSYTYGRTNNRDIVILDQTGAIAAPGIQGFPGFTPGTEVDDGRHSVALYIDAEAQVSDRFLIGAAGRYEDYSDFGNTLTGKLSGRFQITDRVALRGTLANGFRAPSVQQQFYSQVSTNLNSAGILTDTLTARQDSTVTRAFGIKPLKEETSVSGSIGLVMQPTDHTSLTIDAFRIDIDDRIVFSSNIAPEDPSTCNSTNSNCPIAALLAPLGVGQVLFFTNAIDTRTTGLDIVASHDIDLSNGDNVAFQALANFNRTKVKKRTSQSPILSPEALFDDTQVTLIEKGQPREHFILSTEYKHDRWDGKLSANYYGSVEGQGFTPGVIQEWGGKWLFDLNLRYALSDHSSISIGGNNIFDTYPDKWDKVTGFPFPQLGFTYCWETCPFGINGGFYYARFDYKFK